MEQNIQQPTTHSLLRQSQRRRNSISSMQQNLSPSNYEHKKAQHSKYHYDYSKSSNRSSHKKGISSSLYESKYLSKQNDTRQSLNVTNSHYISREANLRHSIIIPKTHEKTVVCQSLPKTRPKYSFTFTNPSTQIPQQSVHITHENQPQLKPQTPRISLNQQSPFSQTQRPQYRSPDVRKDMDICLYAINDKLKELQQQQKQTKNLIQSKFKNIQGQDSTYRPSISQIRKNKKMYLDKSIHRIHPEIVEQYIQTVYRDYDIPDPLKSTERKERYQEKKQFEISQFEITKIEVHDSNRINNKQQFISIQSQPHKSQLQPLPFKSFRQQQFLHNPRLQNQNRTNNLISQQKQQQKTTKSKRKFLNLTLSKQKTIQPKNFASPNQKPNLSYRNQESSRSKSESNKSKHSSSQKKILEIKKNIATWNDSENRVVERYSYIQSPFEIINKTQPHQTINENSSHEDPASLKIRPFQQVMKGTKRQEDETKL